MLPRPVKPDFLATPGAGWRKRRNGWDFYWTAKAAAVECGYRPKSVKLWTTSSGQPIDWAVVAATTERLQAEMLEWCSCVTHEWDPRAVFGGTMDSLIRIYREDPDSPFQNLRFRTKQTYESKLRTLSVTVGKMHIPSLSFRDFKRWHEGYAKPAKDGSSTRHARAHGLMTQVRLLIAFGALLGLKGCREAKETLGGMEFKVPKKRTTFITAAQTEAIRTEAHRRRQPSIALAQALMFELMLRQRDVLGEYLPMAEPGMSAVLHHGRKWLYGITLEEISPDLILTHRLSKSLRGRGAIMDPSAGKIEAFDLTAYPMVIAEIQHVHHTTGPLVLREDTGRPWDSKSFARAWRKIAKAVGIPSNVQNRDSRAGGITEALDAGVPLDLARRHAAHSRAETTVIYARDSLEAKAKVIGLRVKNRPVTAK